MVQVETHGQGGQALHVGAVDQLLPADNVGLEGDDKATSATGDMVNNTCCEVTGTLTFGH